MTGVNLEQALRSHRESEAAAAASYTAHLERSRELSQRSKEAGELARSLTDITGFSEAETMHKAIYDTRVSSPISLGRIESEPGKYGFAKLYVYYGLERVERPVKGRFFTHTEVDRVPNDRLQELTIAYFAGNEDATELENIAYYHWSIPSREDESAIAGVEAGLAQLSEVLGYSSDTPTE